MSIGFWQIAIVVILVVLLFGRGKISGIMGDVAKGIKSFKKGMSIILTKLIQQQLHHLKTSQAKIKIPKKNNLKCHKLDGLRY